MTYPRRIGFRRFAYLVLMPALAASIILSGIQFGAYSASVYVRQKRAEQNFFWEALAGQKKYDSSTSAGQFVAELQPLLANVQPTISTRLRLEPRIVCNTDCYPNLEGQIGLKPFVYGPSGSLTKTLSNDFMKDLSDFEKTGLPSVRVSYPVLPSKVEQVAPFIFASCFGLSFLVMTGLALTQTTRRRRHPNRRKIEQALRDLRRVEALPGSGVKQRKLVTDLKQLIAAYEAEPDEIASERSEGTIQVLSDDIRSRLREMSEDRNLRADARAEVKSW